ncbi:hypothetical protein Pnap_4726 (plasmid) [Polaromonas naphthalenivorans CJ2]|uniref:Lysozyme inhibitor LprI N-terminal domain-containing protein n=2 Tax=Polaromonas naphthalenivorans TaxID=216465 RepID=A1VWV9_POLNA|nr:hypothetical protein Pnap_4726 [Polaromonas naphthalenivorans CJ2]
MVIIKHQGVILASALGRGAAAVAGAWLLMLGHAASSPFPDQPKTTAAPRSAALAPVQRTACPLQPAAAATGRKDGKFSLQADLSGMTAKNIASFIVLGKEAAAAGRPRDAEVAFLMSCRVADKLKGMDSVESADAKYQLGWLYAGLALEDGSARASRAELRRRAQRLYADSLRTYLARYGQAHEKSRFAAEGLKALGQPVRSAQEGTSPPSQALMPPSQARRNEAAQAALPAPHGPSTAAPPGPSFDCAKARSMPEKMICSDAELARLDRELGRVYARAKSAAADGAAFGRQNSEEWRRREATCRDRECLLRWYANRHDQLMHVIEGPKQEPAPSTVSR